MLYSCALVFFACAACCLTTIGLFSGRWMLVEASVFDDSRDAGSVAANSTKATTFIAIGLWETRRVPFYHYYYKHRAHAVMVYHETILQQRSKRQLPTAVEVPDTSGNTSGIQAIFRPIDQPTISETSLIRMASAHRGALVAVRVLLFVCLALGLIAVVKLAVGACQDSGLIRHRYKERALAYTLVALCSTAFLLSVAAWSVFLGTLYNSVVKAGETSEVLDAGFICTVLASLTTIVSATMAACSIAADE